MNKEEIFYTAGYRITEKGNAISSKSKKLKSYLSTSGYLQIGCRYKGKVILCKVHRLQAYQKYGSNLYLDGIETRHKNGNKLDNSYNNILIGTHSENMIDIDESIRISKALHATSFIRKYDKTEVQEFHIQNGNSYKKTMKNFSISSKGTLHYILNN